MKVVGSMVVRNEFGRWLTRVVPAALEWCDELRVLDDGSTDGTFEWLQRQERVAVARNPGPAWAEHEGRARQALYEWTLDAEPDFVAAIDADEVVSDPAALRAGIEKALDAPVFALRIVEVWGLGDPWTIRVDGGWAPHPLPMIYRPQRGWRIRDRQLACNREPPEVRSLPARPIPADLLHLGWALPEARPARAERYQRLDGGRFHAGAHLDSILWPDERCTLEPYEPPVWWT